MAEQTAASTDRRFVNPYVGPKPFTVGDRSRFHGRDSEIRDLTSLLIAHREVVLYSPSGAGKTSLLMAGVFPRLQDRGLAVLPAVRVVAGGGRRPAALVDNIYAFNVLQRLSPEVDPAALASQTLKQHLSSCQSSDAEDPATRLRILMFDQFEELFTTYPERWKDREPFLQQVAEALESDRRLRVLFALREEFVGKLRPYSHLFPNDLRQWFQLDRLREGAALKAIVLPAQAAGRTWAPGVAEALVEQLAQIRVRTADGQVQHIAGEFIEPVQLQIVCRKVWDDANADATEITAATVRIGSVDTALREYYEEQLAEVSRETRMRRRKLRRWFERRFITQDGWRARVFEQNRRVAGLASEIAERFTRRYLLRSDSQGDVRWFELAHDRLLGPIQIAAQRHRRRELPLQVAAAAAILLVAFLGGRFAYQRFESAQLDRDAVALAASVAADPQPETKLSEALAITLRAYPLLDRMDQSAALKDALQYAVNSAAANAPAPPEPRAETPTSKAEAAVDDPCGGREFPYRQIHAAAVSPDGRYVATSSTRPTRSLTQTPAVEIWDALTCVFTARRSQSREAERLSVANGGRRMAVVVAPGAVTMLDAPQPPADPKAQGTVTRARTEGAPLQTLGRGDFEPGLLGVVLGSTGKYFVTTAWDGTTTVWNLPTRDERWSIPVPADPPASTSRPSRTRSVIWDTALNPTETLLATAHDDGSVGLWNPDDGRGITSLRGHTAAVRRVTFSPSGDLLATASWDKTIKIWRIPGGELVRTLAGHTRPVNAVAFSPSGQLLVSASSDGTARIWDLADGSEPRTLKGHRRSVRHAVFSPDGTLVASAGADHLALVSDVRDGSIISTLKHPQTVWSISFSPDSAHVATASEDGEGRVWETRSGKMVASLKDAGPRLAPLADIRFTRAGDAVVTVGSDDTCRWWNWRTQSENFRVWGHGTASATGALALDPGGSTLAVSEPGGAVRLLDAATQKARSSFEATQGAIAGMVFDETGKVLVTAGERPGLRVFDVSGTVVEDFDQDRAFTVVAADAGAARIVAAPSEGAPVLWQRNRRTTLPLAEAPSKVLALALNPGVDVIAGATAEHGLVAWSAATGALIGKEMRPYDASTMPRDRHPVRALGFSADGRALTLVLDEDVRRVDTSTFYETDLPRLLAKAFERLPGGSALNQAIASALRGEIASAIARLEKLTNEQERQTAQRLQLLSKLQGGRFTPLDLRTYFQ